MLVSAPKTPVNEEHGTTKMCCCRPFSLFLCLLSLSLCLRVVCVGVVWCAVLLCVVVVRRAGVEQLYQEKGMIGGIGNVLFSTYSQTLKWVRSKGFFGEPLKHVITVRGQILVSRTEHSKRPRVCVQNVPVCTGNMSTCFFHVGMMLAHTGTF